MLTLATNLMLVYCRTLCSNNLTEMVTDGTIKDTSSELNSSGSIDLHGDVNMTPSV